MRLDKVTGLKSNCRTFLLLCVSDEERETYRCDFPFRMHTEKEHKTLRPFLHENVHESLINCMWGLTFTQFLLYHTVHFPRKALEMDFLEVPPNFCLA